MGFYLPHLRHAGFIWEKSKTLSRRIFVFGEGESFGYAGVITKFPKRVSGSLEPAIYGEGNLTRNFISVDDLIDPILLAADVRHPLLVSVSLMFEQVWPLGLIMILNLDFEPVFGAEKR
jgi:nucleoside-diphosphate-sugar epimerase